jgi:hypothetical protein
VRNRHGISEIGGQVFSPDRLQIPRFLLGFALAVGALLMAESVALSLLRPWVPDPLLVGEVGEDGAPHPFLLWESQPGLGDQVSINSMGMRGELLARPKPARERRLMVVGDGVGFGQGVAIEQTLGQVAVDELGGERVGLKAINGAVPGYSTLQSLNLMDLRGWSLAPDVLVILESPTDRQVSTHVDEEVIPLVQQPGALARLLYRSALFQLVDYRIGVLHGRHHRRYRAITGGEIDGNPDHRARLGPNARALAVRTLVERCQDREVGVVFVISPVPADLEGPASAEVQIYRQVIRDAAGAASAELVEGGEVFAHTGRPASELFLDGVHPTALGHRMLGRAVAKTLSRWIRGEPAGGGSRGGPLPSYPEPGQEAE